jgi:hypothetical protein
VLLAGWSNGHFNVLAQSGKKFHQASNGKITHTVSHQQRNLRLLHTENLGDLYLREDVSASFGYASAAAVLLSWLGSHI